MTPCPRLERSESYRFLIRALVIHRVIVRKVGKELRWSANPPTRKLPEDLVAALRYHRNDLLYDLSLVEAYERFLHGFAATQNWVISGLHLEWENAR